MSKAHLEKMEGHPPQPQLKCLQTCGHRSGQGAEFALSECVDARQSANYTNYISLENETI